MSDFAADALAFLEAVGVPRATVVGHSMGGLVAQQLAMDHPDRVERLVLVSTAANPSTEGGRALQARIETLTEPEMPAFLRELSRGVIRQPVPEAFVEGLMAESRKVPLRVWRAASAGLMAFDRAGDLSKIGAPTLVVCGGRDDIFPREEQERLRDGIPRATLRVYEYAGHGPHWEEPERFALDLSTFVESTP
jgi:pimeloyl-ACP methyl ester carboxylesterase